MALVGEAHIIIRADTSAFKKEIEAALNSVKKDVGKIGKDIGRDLSKGINSGSGGKGPFSKLAKEAEQAKNKFNSLIKTGYAIGPAIAGAVSAISDLVQGLFAVGSAVGAAAPALVALPGIMAAIAQGAITAKIAFGGVMKGIQAITKAKTGAGGDKGESTANQRAIEDARRRLAQVYQKTAETMAAANDKVRKAQIALNQAYKEGAESLQQLGFDAEDAALAQDRAAIVLERARESLLRTQDVPVDSRARREAELAFKEAELNYRQAKDKSSDLAEAQKYAARTGIEGTKEVLSAKQDLGQAEADRAKQERDNAQDIMEAQRALQRALEDSAKKASSASKEISQALKDLSPEAAKFAKHMADLRPEFLKLRHAAGKELFGPLTGAMDNIVKNLFPVLKPILTAMGGVIGKIAVQFSNMLTKAQNLDIFKRVFGGTNLKVMENIGGAFVNLAEAVLNVLDAARPLILEFSKWIKHVSSVIKLNAIVGNSTGELSGKFSAAGEAVKKIGNLIKSLWQAFSPFGKAAKNAGFDLIDSFSGALDKMKEFGKAGQYSGELETHFNDVGTNVKSIGHFLGEVIKLLYALGGNPGVKAFFDQISQIPMLLLPAMQGMTGMGDAVGKLLVSITKILVKFAETGGMTNFFSILTKAADILVKVFDNKLLMQIFAVLAAIKGVTLALGVMGKTAAFSGKILVGSFATMTKGAIAPFRGAMERAFVPIARYNIAAKKAGNAPMGGFAKIKVMLGQLGKGPSILSKMSTAMAGLLGVSTVALGPILAIVAAIALVVAIVVIAYKKSEIFREAVSKMAKALKNTLGDALSLISSSFKGLGGGVSSVGDIFKKIGDYIGKYVIPVITFLVQVIIKYLAYAISMIIGIVRVAVSLFVGLVKILYFLGKLDFKSLKKAFFDMINGIIDGVNVMIRAVNSLTKYLGFTIPEIGHLGEKTEVLTESQKKAADAMEKHSEQLRIQAVNAEELNKKFKDTGAMYDFLTDKATSAFGAATKHARALIASRDAAKALKETDKQLADALKDSAKTTIDKKDSLYEFAGAYLDAADAAVKAGKGSKFVADIIDTGRKQFIDGAKAIGMGGDAAKKLADNLGLSPETIKKTFKVNGIDDLRDSVDLLERLKKALPETSKAFKARLAKYMKEHPNAPEAVARKEVTQQINAKIIGQESKIAVKMEMNFGRGQNKDKPMFVEVTNPIATGKGQAGTKYTGGQVKGGSTYLVGERGPELFQAPTSGNIVPNHQVGMGSTINLTVNPSPGMDERELANLMSRRLAFLQRGA